VVAPAGTLKTSRRPLSKRDTRAFDITEPNHCASRLQISAGLDHQTTEPANPAIDRNEASCNQPASTNRLVKRKQKRPVDRDEPLSSRLWQLGIDMPLAGA
jgi:hypothetical protein